MDMSGLRKTGELEWSALARICSEALNWPPSALCRWSPRWSASNRAPSTASPPSALCGWSARSCRCRFETRPVWRRGHYRQCGCRTEQNSGRVAENSFRPTNRPAHGSARQFAFVLTGHLGITNAIIRRGMKSQNRWERPRLQMSSKPLSIAFWNPYGRRTAAALSCCRVPTTRLSQCAL